jgi:hypothetical protein
MSQVNTDIEPTIQQMLIRLPVMVLIKLNILAE